MTIVLMLKTRESKPMARKMTYNSNGRMSRRKAVVTYTTPEPSIIRHDSLDIYEPMMSNAPGTVIPPIIVMGWLMTEGILSMPSATIRMAR